jgi:hypothetical protein
MNDSESLHLKTYASDDDADEADEPEAAKEAPLEVFSSDNKKEIH